MRNVKTEDGNRTGPPGGTEKVKGREENYEIIRSDAPRPRWIYRVPPHGGSRMTTPQ